MSHRVSVAIVVFFSIATFVQGQDEGPPSPWKLRAALAQKPTGKDLERLKQQIAAAFKKNLAAGAPARVEETLACWAIDVGSADKPPRVVQTDGEKRWDMTPVGDSGLFVLFLDVPNFTAINYAYEVAGKRSGAGRVQVEHVNYNKDSFVQDGVPRGVLTKNSWKSKVFAGTERDYWVYVPAQYDGKTPACVMVFQDGASYIGETYRTPIVLDNLIHKKEIPVIIGIFINPGAFPKEGKPVSNRSFEYDTLSDQYARFIRDEMLAEVGNKYKLRSDPESRAIGGASSGGICAFTVAWEMPDQFGKVLSHIGSFTNIRGGDKYPGMIRKTPKKNIRVYLQDGSNDLDNEHGNWPLGNQAMAAALKYKGYDYTLIWGQGFHSGRVGGADLPNAMRWLWRDYKAPEK